MYIVKVVDTDGREVCASTPCEDSDLPYVGACTIDEAQREIWRREKEAQRQRELWD